MDEQQERSPPPAWLLLQKHVSTRLSQTARQVSHCPPSFFLSLLPSLSCLPFSFHSMPYKHESHMSLSESGYRQAGMEWHEPKVFHAVLKKGVQVQAKKQKAGRMFYQRGRVVGGRWWQA